MIILILIALAIFYVYGLVALIKAIILGFAVVGFFYSLSVVHEDQSKWPF